MISKRPSVPETGGPIHGSATPGRSVRKGEPCPAAPPADTDQFCRYAIPARGDVIDRGDRMERLEVPGGSVHRVEHRAGSPLPSPGKSPRTDGLLDAIGRAVPRRASNDCRFAAIFSETVLTYLYSLGGFFYTYVFPCAPKPAAERQPALCGGGEACRRGSWHVLCCTLQQ